MIPNHGPSMECGLGETADAIRETTSRFVADRIPPIAAEIDETNTFPRALWPEMGDLGLHGVTVEEEFGGLGLGYLEHVVAVEEVSRGSASVGLSYGAHSNLCVNQIRRTGTPAQKRKYLPKLIRAEQKGDRYILNGTKMWITNGPYSDTFVIYAKTDPAAGPKGITAFLVER